MNNVSCKKILINQAEQGYGVSDHYVNSLNIYIFFITVET